MIKTYYLLTKPGIIYGNSINTAGGFLLAAKGVIDPLLFLAALIGTAFVIGSACVFNNYIDREIDEKMARTKKRALVTGDIPVKNALIFGTLLGILGFLILFSYTNLLTGVIGVIGVVMYVVVYGYFKRRTVHGTLIGSISGAIPPVAGYTAVTNLIDTGAILLFLILVFWQMPHFYAIAVYRLEDYKKAGIPVLSVVKGISTTKKQILFYTAGFILASLLLSFFGYTGYTYAIVIGILGLWWLKMAIDGFKTENDIQWARKVFKFSLIVTLVFSALISLEVVLP